MIRLFYLVSSIDSAKEISDDLHEHDVTDWRFHIVSKDEAGLYTHQLHTASILDRTDLPRYVERGAIVGFVLALAFLVPMALLEVLNMPAAAWIALFIFVVVAGAWVGGFGGIQNENYRIEPFHHDIEAGKYLIMVDAPKDHIPKVKELMAKNHPEAKLQGKDSSINNPFAGRRRHKIKQA
ncbi:hypothetical protein [Marinobacter sp.]|jgi:hypothetical protein|uniref:hypothetical protein n=1 Tax=Marinobacter sp. TaxID=50741 RepID=UPI000C60D053|nr:hypothetical protein [Marinobacter sp.]MBE95628.1 hypothetical protein [Marinobacter sp.]MBP55740.1 hypothetical protein [Marinobacter sp.]|tara:strand:- start:3414 stop:3956 length:543 start_codon:yes stop_codon:yes gene_type:complete